MPNMKDPVLWQDLLYLIRIFGTLLATIGRAYSHVYRYNEIHGDNSALVFVM